MKVKRLTGKVWGFRGDGYPMVESEQTRQCIVLTEYRIKPETGEEVEFEITVRHGNIANARRVDDIPKK